MSADTAAKRLSAMNVLSPWRGPAVVPSGTVDDTERATVLFLYSGLSETSGSSTTLGPSVPTTFTQGFGSNVSWTNPGNVAASDDSRMTAAVDGSLGSPSDRTKAIRLAAFDPALAVPAGAIVDGIEVAIERSATNSDEVHDLTVQLVKGTSLFGTNKATATFWPTTDGTATYGGSSDLWGVTFTDTTIDSSFGVALSAKTDGAGAVTARVDLVTMTVTYHVPTPPDAQADHILSDAPAAVHRLTDAPASVHTLTDAPAAVHTITDTAGGVHLNEYIIGETVTLSDNIKVAGVDTDPTALTLKVRDPSGTVDTYTYAGAAITKDSTGDYHKDYAVDQVGVWWYQFVGTGTAAGLAEKSFRVVPTQF